MSKLTAEQIGNMTDDFPASEDLKALWEDEKQTAEHKYGPFASAHEGYGVLAEEVAELLEAIHKRDIYRIVMESVQVSAVAYRIAESMKVARCAVRSGCA
jgi:hypothetical protein